MAIRLLRQPREPRPQRRPRVSNKARRIRELEAQLAAKEEEIAWWERRLAAKDAELHALLAEAGGRRAGSPESLLAWRQAAGLSQAQAAAHLGVSASLISMLEHGKRGPGMQTALRIMRVTGLSLDALIHGVHGPVRLGGPVRGHGTPSPG